MLIEEEILGGDAPNYAIDRKKFIPIIKEAKKIHHQVY